VTEAGANIEHTLVFDLEIKHWCWEVEVLPFTTFKDEYFIEDANHPLANVKNSHPKTVNIPRFNFAFNSTYGLVEADIIATCGPWTFQAEFYDAGTLSAVNTSIYTFDILDVDALSVDIRTDTKELARSTDGNVEYEHTITGWFEHYPLTN